MNNQIDLDLRTTVDSGDGVEVRPPNRPTAAAVAVGLFAVAAGFAIYLVFGRQASEPVTPQARPAAPATAAAAETPLGAEPEVIEVPPLDQSDPVVRQLVGKLSSHPTIAAWLATDGLIRNFTVVVANISEGKTPVTHLRAMAPSNRFQTAARGDGVIVDPRSYARYDRFADAIGSVDAAGSARLYATVKPRIEEASRELGYAEGAFDRMLERAIVALLATPIPQGPLEVQPASRGIGYSYRDPALESLSGAQKHLLRMGPRNAHIVQEKLRAIAQELGIAADRLPSAR
jgi:hypothetical protein